MEARLILVVATLLASSFASHASAQPGRGGRLIGATRVSATTQNFIVYATDQDTANKVAEAAETCRRDLANHWLGRELPTWTHKCPIMVKAHPTLGAGGATTYSLSHGALHGLHMDVQGSIERIIDSVIPHEVTHTILASHFAPSGRTVPRWADEGASTTIEHQSEKAKHEHFLVEFLSQGRGIPFATMFTLKEYPADIMPLYAQGYSVVAFLIAQSGPQEFVRFLETGLASNNWVEALNQHYGYATLGKLQVSWNRWVADGGGPVESYTAVSLGVTREALAGNLNGQPNVVLASNVQSIRSNADWQPIGSAQTAVEQASNVETIPAANTPAPMSLVAAAGPSTRVATNVAGGTWYHRQLDEDRNNTQPTMAAVANNVSSVEQSAGLAAGGKAPAPAVYSTALPLPYAGAGATQVPLYR